MRITPALVALALGSACTIDTELGLATTIDSASAEVRAGAAGDEVAVELALTYRVGEHAQESHELMPQAIDVLTPDNSVVATVIPDRPPGFVPRVMPGQAFQTTFTGVSRPAVTLDPRRLCGGEARVVFRWMDAATGELGSSEATASPVACD